MQKINTLKSNEKKEKIDPSLCLHSSGIHNSALVFHNYGDKVSSFVELFSPYMFLYGKVSMATDRFVLTEITSSHNFTYSSSYSELMSAETSSLHRHEFYEITYVLSGTLHMVIEGESYYFNENDYCICNKNIRHVELHDMDCEYFLIMLQEDFFKEVLGNEKNDLSIDNTELYHPIFSALIEANTPKKSIAEPTKEFIAVKRKPFTEKNESVLLKEKDYDNGKTLTEHLIYIINSLLISMTTRKSGWYYKALYYLCHFLSCLEDSDFYEPEYYSVKTPIYEELFIRISMIIEEHNGNISRTELERQMGYTGDHLTRIIHRYTGMNFVEYCQKFSLLEAERLLTETTMNIGDICLLLGYTNRTHFNKIFKKKYGVSPKIWRKKE